MMTWGGAHFFTLVLRYKIHNYRLHLPQSSEAEPCGFVKALAISCCGYYLVTSNVIFDVVSLAVCALGKVCK
ncbi:hypothetical protein [uncultured Gammaproteobacteria bacterium]|nr:hypothetical protein [uncultured Gammaproteobacteria bacterium]